jgi:hypothetical protein
MAGTRTGGSASNQKLEKIDRFKNRNELTVNTEHYVGLGIINYKSRMKFRVKYHIR